MWDYDYGAKKEKKEEPILGEEAKADIDVDREFKTVEEYVEEYD